MGTGSVVTAGSVGGNTLATAMVSLIACSRTGSELFADCSSLAAHTELAIAKLATEPKLAAIEFLPFSSALSKLFVELSVYQIDVVLYHFQNLRTHCSFLPVEDRYYRF